MTFDPKFVEVTCVTLPKDHCVQVPWSTSKYVYTVILFFKNLNQRTLTPRWPLTQHLLRSHVWLPKDHCVQVPCEYINICGYSDQFCKIPPPYILRIEWVITYFISLFWTKFRRDKNGTHILGFLVKKQPIGAARMAQYVSTPRHFSLMELLVLQNIFNIFTLWPFHENIYMHYCVKIKYIINFRIIINFRFIHSTYTMHMLQPIWIDDTQSTRK